MVSYLMTAAARGGVVGQLEKRILDASSVVEAFGSAQTQRNRKSSRFGKMTKVSKSGIVVSARFIQILTLRSLGFFVESREEFF